jgi:hypothetical protein
MYPDSEHIIYNYLLGNEYDATFVVEYMNQILQRRKEEPTSENRLKLIMKTFAIDIGGSFERTEAITHNEQNNLSKIQRSFEFTQKNSKIYSNKFYWDYYKPQHIQEINSNFQPDNELVGTLDQYDGNFIRMLYHCVEPIFSLNRTQSVDFNGTILALKPTLKQIKTAVEIIKKNGLDAHKFAGILDAVVKYTKTVLEITKDNGLNDSQFVGILDVIAKLNTNDQQIKTAAEITKDNVLNDSQFVGILDVIAKLNTNDQQIKTAAEITKDNGCYAYQLVCNLYVARFAHILYPIANYNANNQQIKTALEIIKNNGWDINQFGDVLDPIANYNANDQQIETAVEITKDNGLNDYQFARILDFIARHNANDQQIKTAVEITKDNGWDINQFRDVLKLEIKYPEFKHIASAKYRSDFKCIDLLYATRTIVNILLKVSNNSLDTNDQKKVTDTILLAMCMIIPPFIAQDIKLAGYCLPMAADYGVSALVESGFETINDYLSNSIVKIVVNPALVCAMSYQFSIFPKLSCGNIIAGTTHAVISDYTSSDKKVIHKTESGDTYVLPTFATSVGAYKGKYLLDIPTYSSKAFYISFLYDFYNISKSLIDYADKIIYLLLPKDFAVCREVFCTDEDVVVVNLGHYKFKLEKKELSKANAKKVISQAQSIHMQTDDHNDCCNEADCSEHYADLLDVNFYPTDIDNMKIICTVVHQEL